MLRFLLAAFLASLLACSDDDTTDACHVDAVTASWADVESRYGTVRTITGAITLPDGRMLRDDIDRSIKLDCDDPALVRLDAYRGYTPIASIVFPRPEQEGTFALEAIGAELVYCADATRSLTSFVRECQQELDTVPVAQDFDTVPATRVSLHGSIVVHAKPALESAPTQDGCAYAFALQSDDAAVFLDVIAFSGKSPMCGSQP